MRMPALPPDVVAMWVASALLLGATAGLFWVCALLGLAPAIGFACLAGGFSVVQLAAGPDALLPLEEGPRTTKLSGWKAVVVTAGAAGITGALVASLLGQDGSNTWLSPLSCFSLWGGPVDWFGHDITLEVRLWFAAFGFVAASSGALILRWRARLWERWHRNPGALAGLLEWSASSSLLVGFLWSRANQTIGTQGFPNGHDACSPDIGPVAVLAYGVAGIGFAMALRRRLAQRPSEWRVPAIGAGIVLAFAASWAQASQSLSIARSAPLHGCGCSKSGPAIGGLP
jgi:hypothetical protein